MFDGYGIKQHHFSAQPPNAMDADMPIRLFRNNKGIRFFGFVHEHPEKKLNEGIGKTIVLRDVDIAHDGYTSEEKRRNRFFRNYQLMLKDREKYPDRILGKILIMRDRLILCRYELENTGGEITKSIVDNCNKVIKMYQDNFKVSFIAMRNGVNPLSYYSDAMRILNRGIEVDWTLSVGLTPDGKNRHEQRSGRFEDYEEALLSIKSELVAHCEPITGEYI
jgi:hypothetical protein